MARGQFHQKWFDADFERALPVLAAHKGHVTTFKYPGLPSFNKIHVYQKGNAAFRGRFNAVMAEREQKRKAERAARPIQRRPTNRYTRAQFEQALEAFVNWDGGVNDFTPVGLPKYFYIIHRAKNDPVLAAAFREAQQRRIERLRSTNPTLCGRTLAFSAAVFDRYLEAIRTSTCPNKTAFRYEDRPGLPSWETVKNHAKRDPDFRAKLQAALESKGWQKGRRMLGGRRFERYGDADVIKSIALFREFTGSSVFYYSPPQGLPAYPTIVRAAQRSEEIAQLFFAAQEARIKFMEERGLPRAETGPNHKRVLSDDEIASYLNAIRAGKSPTLLCRSTPFSKEVRQRLRRESPAFAEAFAKAVRARLEEKFRISKEKRRARERAYYKLRSRASKTSFALNQLRIQLNLNDYYATADAALRSYRKLPDYILDDVRSDMVEALINESLKPEDAADRAFEFVANYNREFSSSKNLSTDQALFDDGAATRGDYLTTDDYSYAE